MAAKKNWRDEYREKTANSAKNGNWRDSVSGNGVGSVNATSDWRSAYGDDTASTAAGNIINRVNTWIENHNNYITNYQNRYSGRKYNYEDDYVMDSASWLDTVRKQKSNFDAEADSILSYMDQYQDYLDKDWMKSVRETLTGASGTQAKIIESATKDNEWWNSFGSDQELLDEYGSAEDVYKYFQRSDGYSKKYNGMTSEELYGLVGDLDDGEEKSWLSSYASSVDYDEKGKADLNEVAKELDDLGNLYDQAFTIDLWYDEYKRGLTPYDAQKLEAYNRLKNEFGGDAKAVKKAYEQKEQYLKSATDIQKLNSLSAVSGNEDFGQKSEYVSNVEYGLLGKPEFTDNTYAYINNPTVEDKRALGAGQITARDLIGTEYSAYAADSPLRNRDSSYQREALEYIKPEEVKVYNYLYATEGEKKANEYLDLLVSTFQARKNVQTAENVAKFAGEHPILSSALSVGTSIGSGFEYLEDIIEYGGDKLMGKDAELGMNESALVTNAVRSTVSDKVDWEIGNWDAFDFLYNTTMSGVDSFASTAFGGLGGTVLGLSAAAQGTNDALQRGMSNGQAFWNGLISGVFEGLFETISIGNFNKLKDTALNVGLKNIDRSIVKTITKNIGKSMLVNASEEMLTELANITYDTLINGEFANYTIEELFTDGQWKNALNQVIESGASGALMGMGMSMLGSTIGLSKGVKNANAYAVENFGGQTDAFIQEGLENDVKSNSYKLATKYQQQVQGKDGKQGKALTGQQIRNLLAANQEQITPNDIKKIQKAAEKRLTDLGQTEDVAKVAELATKRATGQKLTRAETSFLANSQYGSRVANELLPENIMSGDYATEWAEGIGTKKVNKLAYNIKSILEEMSNIPAGYKSLEKRVSEEDKFSVSESGQATIRSTDQAIDLSKVEVADFVRDKETGKITDMILKADGKEVKASEIDYADDNQSYLFSAVKNIENITPGDATAFIRDYNPSSGQSVGEYLNGIDEAFTYGYHRYSEADMGAGLFTPKLTSEQAKGAYILGQTTRNKSDTNKSEAIKRMRTAVEAETEKAKAEGKAAPKAKELTITYNEGRGKIRDFAKTGMKLHDKQGAGVEIAQILHKLGLGTNFEFFSSYVSKSMKVKDQKTGEAMYARVFINDAGVEEVAPAGVYRKSDGTIRIDLNAYNGRGLTLNALAHELTHFIQRWSDTKYQVLADFLVKTYEKTDMTMHQRVIAEQARLKDIRGKEVSYNEAYDEVVAKAMMKMFDDGKLAEKLTELASVDKTIVEKLLERIRDLFKKFLGFYNSDVLYKDSDDLVGMKDAFEQLQNMFAEALVEASENFQTSLIAKEAGIDIMPVEDGSMYSYSSLAEAAGFAAVENEDGTRSFTREGKKVSKVTINDIDNSPIGAFINFSLEMGDISEADAERQKKMFADICTMACKTNDFAMTMQFVGSAVFTGMKANADKQYGTTYDFPSICTKTQAVIDAMSAKMVSLGRGLNTNEIVQLYEDVFASGNPVPCPECYVFSRWIGIGGLLDNIKKYQDYYGDMNVKDVAAAYLEMKAEVSKFAEEQGISFGKAKGALTAKLTKEFNKLTEKIEKAQNQGEKVKPADKQRLAELEPMMNTVKSMTWLENVYFADSSLKKVNPNFRVPDSVLFDLNNGEAFATKYKEAWAFRTTQGAGYGKAITPYAEARLGEGVLVTNNTTKTIKGRADGSLDNYFLQQMGKLDKKSRDALKRARMKQKIQAFIGGQRFQSTSDARYENASDYLLAALEMQAMGGMVQVYTKVDGAVPAFSAWGFSINQSLMPLNGGLDADGNVKDTGVGGMNPKVAFENRKKHESAGTITIGVNDNHIRAMFKQLVRDFIIPYHASGGKADTIAEFRRIQEGKEAKGEAVRSTDYSRTQSDKVLSDEVLRWQGKTDAQIQRIHEIRNARIAILTGGNPNMTVVRSNRFLSALYEKLNGGEWDGVKLAKSKVESQIFPNEFWDQTVTYEESAKITKDYLEYCEDLGFLHRFSGMIPSNGKLIPANGYNENGERVQLTDLAYKYDEKGNKTAEVEEFFWKVLTDRRMYDNNGKYLAQKVVTLNDTTTDTVTGFAKNNQGREYDKAKAEALAKKITNGEQYSSQETDADKKKNRAFSDSPLTRRSVKQRSVGSTHIKMSSTAAAEILGIENIANYSDSVKEAVTVLGEFYTAIDQKKLVFGFMKPITASNLEGSLVAKNILRRGGLGGSAYRYDKGHALRISNHSAKAENFKGDGEHLSLVLYEKGKLNDFEEAKSNVIEAVFKYRYLDSNPEAFKRLIHDIAHFIVKGEYHDTAGAMRYNFSGTEAFKKRAEKRMARDGVARGQRGEVYSSQETDADNAPIFYSQMGKVVDGMKQEKFGASSVISMLTGRGVKAEEIRWSGIQAFLEGKKSVTKQELLDFINSSMLQIEEEERGESRKYSQEQQKRFDELEREIDTAWDEIWELWEKEFGEALPMDLVAAPFIEGRVTRIINNANEEAGTEISENSKRIIELSRKVDRNRGEIESISYQAETPEAKWSQYKIDGGENYRELLFKLPNATHSNTAMTGHWGEGAKGILAHARLQDFEVAGKKMLFIEEIQSDWHNEGGKRGYSTPETQKLVDEFNEVREKRRPYHDKVSPVIQAVCDKLGIGYAGIYHDLLSKDWNTLTYFDEFAKYLSEEDITNLKVDSDLYKQHMAIRDKLNAMGANVSAVPDAPFKDGKYTEFVLKRLLRMAAEEGYDSIGWTTAKTQDERWANTMPHKEGGGKSGFLKAYTIEYDQDIPKFLKKYGKQWGADVGKTMLNTNSADIERLQANIASWQQDLTEADTDSERDFIQNQIDYQNEELNYYINRSEVWSMDITDAMKKSVLKEGQAMYSSQETDLDSKGNRLTKEQSAFFAQSKVRDENGKLLVMYHGSQKLGFTVFDPNASDDNRSFFFSDSPKVAASYSNSEDEIAPYTGANKTSGLYKTYLNLTNPYVVDAKGSKWNNIVEFAEGDEFLGDIGSYLGIIRGMDSSIGIEDFLDSLQGDLVGATEYAINELHIDEDTEESLFTEEEQKSLLELADRIDKAYSEWDESQHLDEDGESTGFESYVRQNYTAKNTRKIASEAYKNGYDGVIFKNLVDVGKFGNIQQQNYEKSTVAVAFDSNQIKSVDNKKPTSDPDMRFSTQETDNISNRDLLANAFEGLVQNSEEYKLIQEYKGRIRLLNEYEEKLSKLNAEIRKLTFGTEGERDSKKLKELQKEAKEVAGDINRNDKILVSLEASEPLRRVIEQERKKEAQKTKANVKELLKNKKSRAEQTELRHKIRKAVRDLDKLLNRGNKKQNVKEDMKGFVSKALELADYIFTDHVTNDDLIRRGITVRMTPREEALVKETEDILNQLYDNADSLTDEEFTRLDAKRKANEEKLRDLLKAQRNESLNTPVYNLFDDLVSEYASLKNSSQDSVKAAYNEELENSLRAFMSDDDRVKILKNMRVADMTTEELNWLYRAYTMVLTNVRNANKFHVDGMNATIEQVVGQIAGDFGSRKIPDKKMAIAMQKLVNKLGWDYEKLYYALDRIGSEAFTKLIMNIADSENTVMQDVMEAAAFRDKMVETYGFNNWDVNKEIDREFLDNTGKKFKLTLGQLMALYAYSRREGAWDHIEYGGFVFGEAALTNPRPADSYKLSKEQCEAITNLLTKEQKGYAEDMQKYLSETMGAKGNEVSMLLYGIKMFGEKNYFPIHIAGQFKAQAQESQAKAAAGFGSMSNAGFTHAQNPNAKAPFVLEGFNEIWVDHVNEMSRYHGTVPALEDLRRVMNRSTYSDSVAESQSIKQIMENSYGKEAVDYFDNLYREANSGAITDKLQKTSKKLLSMFRKNSVAYSLSVLIQQPTSIIRAYALIDKKYFGFKGFGSITSGVAKAVSDKWTKAHTNAHNEMLKYAPGVTMAKEIGGFDTHTGGSIRSYLLDTKKSLKQKWNTGTAMEKGKAVLDLVDDNAIANLPNLADKIAWIEIWNACKRETVATHKDLAANSEEFMKVVGDRFTEVIRATQVYDSMFAKSPMLKSKNLAVQYLVSFMNEPNTVANMAESALRDAVRGNWKDGVKKAIVLAYGTIAVGMAKSLIYAMRDDDEDETFVEKYIESLTGSLLSDFNPISYIPVARDVLSAAQGYDVERPDMAIVVDAISALDAVIKNNSKDTEGMSEEQLAELDKKVTDANWKLVESLAAFFGIPVKNIRRDVKGVFDHAMIASANAGQTTVQSAFDKVYDAVVESVPFLSAPSKQDKLYEAIISGDTEYVNRLKSTYKSDDAYDSAVRKALRENDPRIKEAAQARYDGNTEEYKRIFREIQKEGKFSFDNIMGAINAEVSKLTPDKVSSDYTASEFVESIVLGDTKSAQAMKEDIIATKVANGKSKSEAEKDFASNVATGIREAYTSGLLDEAGAEKMLVEYADKDEEETVSKVSYWSFIEEHKEYKDDLSESNVKDYKEFAEPAEIPLDVFVQYVEGTKGLTSKKDEWGDVEVTKREQVLEVIDSLPLTWEQKDALYLAAGYSENQIWDVPW